MLFGDKKNFLELSSFNCSIAKLFGYFYFSTRSVRNKKIDSSLIIWFIANVIFGLWASIKSSQVNIGRNTSSIIVNMSINFVIAQTLFMPTIFRIFNFVARRQHGKLLCNIQSIDDELLKMKIDFNYSKHFVVAVSVTFAYFTFICFTFYVDNKLSLKYLDVSGVDLAAALLIAMNLSAYLSYQLSHMLIVFAIYKRLQFFNRCLQMKDLDVQIIKKLGKLHIKLANILELMNECFSISLLSYFLQFIIYSIFFFFSFYHYLTSLDVTFSDLILNIISFLYFLFFFWFGAWMIIVSSWIKSEGNETASIINSKKIQDEKVLRACNDLCLQLYHIKLKISCGLFTVDWIFLLGFISALFSYLIILIQFESG